MKQDYKYPEIKQDKIENQEMRTHRCSDKSQKHKGKGNVSENSLKSSSKIHLFLNH